MLEILGEDCNAKSLDDVGSDEFAGKLGRSIRKDALFCYNDPR